MQIFCNLTIIKIRGLDFKPVTYKIMPLKLQSPKFIALPFYNYYGLCPLRMVMYLTGLK